jgi:hypothetical protein
LEELEDESINWDVPWLCLIEDARGTLGKFFVAISPNNGTSPGSWLLEAASSSSPERINLTNMRKMVSLQTKHRDIT